MWAHDVTVIDRTGATGSQDAWERGRTLLSQRDHGQLGFGHEPLLGKRQRNYSW